MAVDHGVEYIYVSNHGGRQLDHGRGAMDVLPEVVETVGASAKVIVDGGFCRGTDLAKGIALGAHCIGLGRLYCYALAAAGPAGVDMFVLAVFANALVGLGNVYFGAALRARNVAIESAHRKTSLGLTRSMAYHPHVQHSAAEMDLMVESVGALLDRVADDWSNGVDHGMTWPAKIVGAKYTAVESAKKIVDIAMDMSGGSGFFRANELERIYRDVRGGGFHPANSALTHEIVGKTALGIGLDENPRWG